MRTPAFWYRPIGWQSLLLLPLALLYGFGRFAHELVAKPRKLPGFTICVGNLVAGGAGKTPITSALAVLLQNAGCNVQAVLRGYGGTQRLPKRVMKSDAVTLVSDEAKLLESQLTTWVAHDRLLGVGCAMAAGAGIVLLDDGLQSQKISATLNLLVVDGASGFGNGMLLPAGPLRELPRLAVDRIDAIIMIGKDAHKVRRYFPTLPLFEAAPQYDLTQLDLSRSYLAFAGLARPEKFFEAVRKQGITVVETRSFSDHHIFSLAERKVLRARAETSNASLLTTAKDAVRWPADESHNLAVLPMQLKFDDPKGIIDWLKLKKPEAFHA